MARPRTPGACSRPRSRAAPRSEEHTSELQSRLHLVCRLLLEKKKNNLDLMSSENPAVHALRRTYPGWLSTFVTLMNTKAKLMGMHDTTTVEPTAVTTRNRPNA